MNLVDELFYFADGTKKMKELLEKKVVLEEQLDQVNHDLANTQQILSGLKELVSELSEKKLCDLTEFLSNLYGDSIKVSIEGKKSFYQNVCDYKKTYIYKCVGELPNFIGDEAVVSNKNVAKRLGISISGLMTKALKGEIESFNKKGKLVFKETEISLWENPICLKEVLQI